MTVAGDRHWGVLVAAAGAKLLAVDRRASGAAETRSAPGLKSTQPDWLSALASQLLRLHAERSGDLLDGHITQVVAWSEWEQHVAVAVMPQLHVFVLAGPRHVFHGDSVACGVWCAPRATRSLRQALVAGPGAMQTRGPQLVRSVGVNQL